MKQRIICIALAALLLLSVLAPLAMAAEPALSDVTQVLAALDIMVGDENGDLNLDQEVTRAQFSKISVASTTYKDIVGDTSSVSPYPDVSKDNWAAPWITVAVEMGIVKGDLYGNFNPNNSITLAEGVTVALRLLGYSDSSFTGSWPSGQMNLYYALDLNEGISIGQDDAMTRQDAMYLFYNLLTTKTSAGTSYYLDALEYGMVTTDGEIDTVALINSVMKGPIVADTGWESSVSVNLSTATVYRDGAPSSYSAISAMDVVYWSDSMNSLWVYSQKVTGTLQSALPSSAPTSVMVAGQSYSIDSIAATYALSDLGTYNVGDQITLLLGRNDGVVAVTDSLTTTGALYGMVSSTSTGTYTDSAGNSYLSDTVTILTTNGSEYTYAVADDSWEVGTLLQFTAGDSGVTLTRLSVKNLSGRVNSDGTQLGNISFASGVEILDVYTTGGTGVRIYPSRLAGITLATTDVAFYATNQQGEITHLILKDVTGDMHGYGVLTTATEISVSTTVAGTYVADSGGIPSVFTSSNYIYGVKRGPAMWKTSEDGLEELANLNDVTFETATQTQGITSDHQSYNIWEYVLVYEFRDNTYYLTQLDRVNDGSYTLTGYYDKDESDGGLIRVIIAKA